MTEPLPQGLASEAETPPPAPRSGGGARLLPAALLAATVLLVVVVRVRLLDTPLERDEGEYAYGGQLLLRGRAMYEHLYTMKLPGTHAAYALAMALFGETIRGVHLGFLAVHLAAVVLVFLLGRRIASDLVGATAAAAYGVLTLGPSVLGPSAHATHFVVVPALAGFLLLERAAARPTALAYGAAGVVLGLAPLMKQSGAFLVLFGGLVALARELRLRPREPVRSAVRLAALGGGVALPYGVVCALVWTSGTFERFWFWTMEYGRAYVAETSWSEGFGRFAEKFGWVAGAASALWVLAAVGLAAPLWDRAARSRGLWLAGLLVCSAVAVTPGLWFRPHYFVQVLPAVALLAAVGIRALAAPLARVPAAARSVVALAACGALAQPLVVQAVYLFELPPQDVSRGMYGTDRNPFCEAVRIGEFLRVASAPGDRVALLTSEPEVCFYADRLSASGYVYMYPFTEDQPFAARMKAEMESEIARAAPAYVLLWLTLQPFQREFAMGGRRYRPICVVEALPDGSAPVVIGAAAERFVPRGINALVLYHRKS